MVAAPIIGGIISAIGGLGAAGIASLGKNRSQVSQLTPEQQAALSEFLSGGMTSTAGASGILGSLAASPQDAYSLLNSPISDFEQDVVNPMNEEKRGTLAQALNSRAASGELSSLGTRALEAGINADYAGKIGSMRATMSMQERQNQLASLEAAFGRQLQSATAWGNLGAQMGNIGLGRQAFDTVQSTSPMSQFMSGVAGTLGGKAISGLSDGFSKMFSTGGRTTPDVVGGSLGQ